MGIAPVALLVAALICVVWAIVSAILLTRMLDKRRLKTPFPFFGLLLFRNIGRHREITRRETGRVGLLFYSYVVPINAAWVLALIAMVVGIQWP
jgi:hypothetical protein